MLDCIIDGFGRWIRIRKMAGEEVVEMKKRILTAIILVIATTGAVIAAFAMELNPPLTNVIGAYGSVLAALIAAKVFKVSDGLYYAGLLFVFAASPMGSVLNLYRSFGPYDKIVHFGSGMLLATLGMMIILYLFKRFGHAEEALLAKLFVPAVCFAFFFSSAGAGIWEIFEFTADRLAGGEMQRGMVDTVTDIIAGNLGALVYAVFLPIRRRTRDHA